MGDNTDVSVSLNGSRSWHFEIPRWLTGSVEPILLIKLELIPKTLIQNQYPGNSSPETAVLETLALKNVALKNAALKNDSAQKPCLLPPYGEYLHVF